MTYSRYLAAGLSLLISAGSVAQDSAPHFYPEQGLLVLPKLDVGGEELYVELRQLPGTLDFRVDEKTIRPAAPALTNGTGAVNAPKLIDYSGRNNLSSNPFFNHFHLNLSAGQRLDIQAQLSMPLTSQQRTRCASSPGRGATPSGYQTQIHIYNSNLQRVDGICGDAITFEAPASGTYIIKFDYGFQSLGEFFASKFSS